MMNAMIGQLPKSILQTPEWAELKSRWGFEAKQIGDFWVHRRKLTFGQSFLYLPELNGADRIETIKAHLTPELEARPAIFTRFEFLDGVNPANQSILKNAGLVKSFEEVQPKWRQVIDIAPGEEQILAQMKSKGRYNIKVAARHNVTVAVGTGIERIRQFYDLYRQTCGRERITARPLKYFADLVDILGRKEYVAVFVAAIDDEILAAAIVTFYDGIASYLYGGTSKERKSAMAPYCLHWEIIKFSKTRGASSYDLLGRSAPGEEVSSWAGVTRFKEQFGGRAVEIEGSWDWILKPSWYGLFRIVEKMRRRGGGQG